MENKEFTITDDLLASKGERFLNYIIDLLVLYVIVLCIGQTIFIIADITMSYGLADWVESMNSFEQSVFAILIVFFYYGLTEMYFSRSIAKYFTKTMVVRKDGSRPNSKTIIMRTLCRLIPFEPFSFSGNTSRGWHDMFSDTYVVKKHEFNEKKRLFYPSDQVGENVI